MKKHIKICVSIIILLFASNANAQETNTKTGAGAGANLTNNTTGYNSFFGYQAGMNTVSSLYNTFVGGNSAHAFLTGTENVTLGFYAGGSNYFPGGTGLVRGNNNVFIGARTFDRVAPTSTAVITNDNVLLGGYNFYKSNIKSDGNIAIGSYATSEYVNSGNKSFFILNNQAQRSNPLLFGYFAINTNRTSPSSAVSSQSQLAINTTGLKPNFALSVNGPTFIGTFDADGTNSTVIGNDKRINFNLWVEKGVISEDFALASVKSWADFVFEKDYKLRPLSEVEKFINENKHLPDVPSAAELKENGASMTTLIKNLTQKVEELTLYAIQQDKQIKALQSELDATKKRKKK